LWLAAVCTTSKKRSVCDRQPLGLAVVVVAVDDATELPADELGLVVVLLGGARQTAEWSTQQSFTIVHAASH
jgi:hypothetical protein